MSIDSSNPREGWTTKPRTHEKAGMLLITGTSGTRNFSAWWNACHFLFLLLCDAGTIFCHYQRHFFFFPNSRNLSLITHAINLLTFTNRVYDFLGSSWNRIHRRALIGLACIRRQLWTSPITYEPARVDMYSCAVCVLHKGAHPEGLWGWHEAHTLLTKACSLE